MNINGYGNDILVIQLSFSAKSKKILSIHLYKWSDGTSLANILRTHCYLFERRTSPRYLIILHATNTDGPAHPQSRWESLHTPLSGSYTYTQVRKGATTCTKLQLALWYSSCRLYRNGGVSDVWMRLSSERSSFNVTATHPTITSKQST